MEFAAAEFVCFLISILERLMSEVGFNSKSATKKVVPLLTNNHSAVPVFTEF